MQRYRPDKLVARICFLTLALFWMLPLAIGAWWYRGGGYVLQFTWLDALVMSALCFYFVGEMAHVARKLVRSL